MLTSNQRFEVQKTPQVSTSNDRRKNFVNGWQNGSFLLKLSSFHLPLRFKQLPASEKDPYHHSSSYCGRHCRDGQLHGKPIYI